MKISNYQYKKVGLKIRISADITFGTSKPETIYLLLDQSFATFYSKGDLSPFLAATLLPAMKLRENILIDGKVSEKLLQNTKKIMALIKKWKIGLSPIHISAAYIQKDSFHPTKIGCFFSAGVDSFYTYLKNKKSGKEKITHFVFVHGFDIELSNMPLYKDALSHIQKIAREEHITVIPVETNIKEVVEKKLEWDWSHGGALAAVALLLRGGLKQVYIAGAIQKKQLFPYGTHPDLDKLWSTETLSVIHDGNEITRLEKVMTTIAKSDVALQNLRVCCQNRRGFYNCSSCFKCVKTMIELTIAGAFEKAVTFKNTIDLNDVRKMYYNYKLKYNLMGELNLAYLKKQKKAPDLQEAIRYSLHRSKHPPLERRIYDYLAYLDRTYNQRRIYRYVFTMKNNDRSILFRMLSARGFIK